MLQALRKERIYWSHKVSQSSQHFEEVTVKISLRGDGIVL